MTQNLQEKLDGIIAHRLVEIEDYKLNIRNFEFALEELKNKPNEALVDFEAHLKELIASHIRECSKSEIMLNAAIKQKELLCTTSK